MPAPRRSAALYVVVTIGASDGAAPWRLPAFAAAAKTRQWTAFVKAEFRLPAAVLSDPVAVARRPGGSAPFLKCASREVHTDNVHHAQDHLHADR
jgi:hypothetical protein